VIVIVSSTLEAAITTLNQKMKGDGIDKQMKINQIAKPSEKIKFKKFLAERRRLRNAGRKAHYAEARGR